MEGKKDDMEKVRWDLLPFDALNEVAVILTFGANKYGDRNWETGMKWGRLIGALFRHLYARILGEKHDQESGQLHLAHAACCILFLLAYEIREKGENNIEIE